MRIEDGLNLKPKEKNRIEIPECSRNDLPEFFVNRGYKIGAEIGVLKGEFTERFCEKGLKMYAIDPWRNYKDYKHPKGQKRLDELYNIAKQTLSKYDNCKIIRKTSMEAVTDFKDDSLDFVYIDGRHEFKYITEDVFEWSKKIRKGGIISGHDYFYTRKLPNIHVRYAIDAYTDALNISPLYILGGKYHIKGKIRDRWRSWMWIKE